ncbi:LysR family transcriptional regulator [Vibrio paucivorans]
MHTLDQLTAFVAVFETQSYSAAGRALSKDRTTVRELVKAYEDFLGFELFQIEGRKAKPTKLAIELVSQCKLVLRQNQKLLQFSLSINQLPVTQLNIGYEEDFPFEFISELEQYALIHYPELRINWIHIGRASALMDIVENKLDIAFLPAKGKVAPREPVLYKHLGMVSYSAYIGTNSSLSGLSQLSLEDAQVETQYVSANAIEARGTIQDFSSHYRVISSNQLVVNLLARNGWALLPNHYAHHWAKQNILKKIASPLLVNDLKVPFSVFYSIGKDSSPVVTNLIQYCEQLASKHLN